VSDRNEASPVHFVSDDDALGESEGDEDSEVSRSRGIQANEAVRRDPRLISQNVERMLPL